MNTFLSLVARDLRLAWREGGAISTALGFYLVVVSILPLGLGPDLNLLSRIAPGVLWVALLLAALLSVDRIFHNDHEDARHMELSSQNLDCVRGGRTVFQGLSFRALAGKGLLLTGPNGSGKSSLLRVIAGFIPASGFARKIHLVAHAWRR